MGKQYGEHWNSEYKLKIESRPLTEEEKAEDLTRTLASLVNRHGFHTVMNELQSHEPNPPDMEKFNKSFFKAALDRLNVAEESIKEDLPELYKV